AGGIDEKIIEKVFEPYFTTSHQSKGKGLSLFNAMKIINNDFDGQINVQNATMTIKQKEYKGARFIISIPNHYSN
ncbi:MAG: HAMP domain-containing histidine kinase, partial [Campylobacterales bacterium]|nr:HAMP domain-containing histidine kinase [Campylobacterales bacterium]